ncbi:hypothetical protein MNV49_004289 [Pseudohyphozyma bogoriensis]|nr:hypothetical protein MNV49_004289 [Pseudohyphozyma bogoriensis]
MFKPDLESNTFTSRLSRGDYRRYAQAVPQVSTTAWPQWALVLVTGVLVGRYLVPSYPTPVFPDFSSWARAAPTLDAGAQWDALSGTEHLPDAVATNLRLTHEECDAGFPLLWTEVKSTRDHFQNKGGIFKKDVDSAEKEDGTRVAIIDGRLYIKRWNPESTTRSQAVLHSLHQAISTSPEPMPDVEFWFRATDNLVYGAHFGLNKEVGKQLWLLVKGWVDYRRKVMELDPKLTWAQKGDKLFWRGAFLSDFRRKLRDLIKNYAWNDVGEIDWGRGAAGRIEMEDHCKHKYLASIEGNSGYSGRLKHLLMCRSVTISHKMKWVQHFHSAFNSDDESPDQNIIEMQTPNSWSELPSIMDELIANPVKSQKIAANAIKTMRGRYLTPASITCYWRRVLAEYASLQQFTPTMGDGTDFESMILKGQVHWDPS